MREMLNRSKYGIMRRTIALTFLIGLAVAAVAQDSHHPTADSSSRPIEFEVASIHPTDPDALFIGFHYTPSGVSIEGAPLEMILGESFTGTDDETFGVPGWAKNARYSIEAKVADADVAKWRNLPRNEQRKALRSLLEQRFALKDHIKKKAVWVFALTVAKGGVRMKQAEPSAKTYLRPIGLGHYVGKSCPMSSLVLVLGGEPEIDNRKIIDRTELSSKYDIDLQWTPAKDSSFGSDSSKSSEDSSTGSGDADTSLFSAIEQQLGLKLVPRKETSDVIVIDSLEKPSAN
jgi:uncharacterized protein (TIGR03435 family)